MEQGFDIRGVLQKLLALPVRDEAQLQRAAALGWEGPPLDYGTLLLIALLEAAVGGNLSAIKELRGLLWESGASGEVTILDDIPA